ncbi:class I SAM-dependent methyltransferase [Roseivirga sp. E12]|uniref:class I SAM-dependent methyltransferase n=1 Tax=Roseivirga sp. E12 TaxID=2819237 RepID=UPI001ABC45DD|nr:class I SAM-dependent methyltransferase [Roseivirga sp. E12]MBO3699319.1 class I SAM-dependent methyltransferase [Roseivirga sp. E12]
MSEHFDIASKTYDQDFTDTLIGRLQRGQVWKYLDQYTGNGKPLHILELNCGTGEDAIHLAQSGHMVTATDISKEMLSRTKEKINDKGCSRKVRLERLDVKNISKSEWSNQFDLVFSNFGGLNCIGNEDLEHFKSDIKKLLKPDGVLILVIMPEFCIWESFYFVFKLKMSEVFRRKKPSVMADVSGVKVETWYYSPKKLSKAFTPEFTKVKVKPIGFFAPPSYMESLIRRVPALFKFIEFMEKRFARFSWQGRMSDHYYIELQAR